jgi:hypothetical protein
MNDAQIQARAIIASALIRKGFVDVNSLQEFESQRAQLRAMVDLILSAVINPKQEP